jgi:hypothetical protein
MNQISTTYQMKPLTITQQKTLALHLLEWHGGQSSALYAVGSCMLSDADKGKCYAPANHRGHAEDQEKDTCGALQSAITELRQMKARANFPEAVTPDMEKECTTLAKKLKTFLA